MNPLLKRFYQIAIIIGGGILLILLSLATPVFLNTNDFSIYNPGWNGCSNLAVKTYETGKLQPTFYIQDNQLTIGQYSFAEYALEPKNATILILGPRAPFSMKEATYLKEFLTYGGLLFIADDFGTGNDILKKLNTSTRFSGSLLLDISFEKNASFFTVFEFKNRTHPIVSNVTHILGNFPSSLQIQGNSKNVTVLITSTEMSWLDENLNRKQDPKEPKGPFPVFAIERYGQGRIVLCSDPSFFINSMRNHLDNTLFRDNLFSYLYNNRTTVIIDESHRDVSTIYYLSYYVSSLGWEVKSALVLLVLGAFLVVFTPLPRMSLKKILRVLSRSTAPTTEASVATIVDEVLAKHPTWKREKLERLLQRLVKP